MNLEEFFSKHPIVAVAFSGGVDSAYLLYMACKYATKTKAYYVKSAFQPQFELDDAERLAKELQADMTIIRLDVLSDEISALHEQYGKKLQWQQVRDLLRERTGLYGPVKVDKDEDVELQKLFKAMLSNKSKDVETLYSSVSALSKQAVKLLDKKAHIGWTTSSHSAAAVPVFAIGVGAERFTGWHDNSEVMPLILKATK